MSKKKARRDVLEDLLGETEFSHIHGLEQLNKLVRRCAMSSAEELKDEGDKTKSTAVRKRPKKKGKKSVSHFVSNKLNKQLTKTKGEVKEFLPQNVRKTITKSTIVEHALFIVLNEFDEKGKESMLVKQILGGSVIK